MCFVFNQYNYDFNNPRIFKDHDYKNLSIKMFRHISQKNNPRNAIVLEIDQNEQSHIPHYIGYSLIVNGSKNGWCTEYHRSGAKKNEGWYVDGQKHGYHRTYKLHMTWDGEKSYLHKELQYVNGVKHGKCIIHDHDREVTVSTYVNGKIHGFVEVPLLCAVQFWVYGNMISADITELNINDHNNLTESEFFTLSMLGL